VLRVRGVSKRFESDGRAVVALDNADLEVREGEFLSLVGPSGCGKTTLLKVIDGLSPASEGSVELEGRRLRGVSKELAFVFQDINLLPWRTVLGNVELGLEARGLPGPERRRRALQALEMVGLEHVAGAPPYTLSGGMQQRVGVARALAVEPKVLLMDEPFGHLDNMTREALQNELAKLWRRIGMTIVFVTHDVDEAIFLSDRIAVFRAAPGRILEVLEVELPHPRWEIDVHAQPAAIELRARIKSILESSEVTAS
jgi:NitT/TauT family transport system ATP-binding protein